MEMPEAAQETKAAIAPLESQAGRRRLAEFALRLAGGDSLPAASYERTLLAQFVRGEFTLDQVLCLLLLHRQD